MSELYDEARAKASERKAQADNLAKQNRSETMSIAQQGKDTITGLYGSTKAAADDVANKNYQNSILSTNDTYDTSEGIVNRTAQDARSRQNLEADQALQQSWISYMQQKRTLPQELKAQGITGGASETSLVDMKNAYGAARSAAETERMKSNAATNLAEQNQIAQAEAERRATLTSLQNDLNTALLQNQRDYNNGLISAEQAYQNQVMSIYSIYQQALNANHSSWDSAIAGFDSSEISAALAAAKDGSDRPKPIPVVDDSPVIASPWANVVRQSIDDGMTPSAIVESLRDNGLSQAEVEAVLKQVGLI